MSVETQPSSTNSWTNPERCPFCDARIEDGGWGFVVHVRANEPCEKEFDMWREQIAGDMAGEWSG